MTVAHGGFCRFIRRIYSVRDPAGGTARFIAAMKASFKTALIQSDDFVCTWVYSALRVPLNMIDLYNERER